MSDEDISCIDLAADMLILANADKDLDWNTLMLKYKQSMHWASITIAVGIWAARTGTYKYLTDTYMPSHDNHTSHRLLEVGWRIYMKRHGNFHDKLLVYALSSREESNPGRETWDTVTMVDIISNCGSFGISIHDALDIYLGYCGIPKRHIEPIIELYNKETSK